MAAVKQITEVDGRKTSITLGNNHVALRTVSCTAVVFFNVGIHLSIVQGVWLRPVDYKAPPRLVPVAIVLDERTCPHLFTLAADFRFPALGCLGFVDVALAVYHNVFVVVVQAKQRLRVDALLEGVWANRRFGVGGSAVAIAVRLVGNGRGSLRGITIDCRERCGIAALGGKARCIPDCVLRRRAGQSHLTALRRCRFGIVALKRDGGMDRRAIFRNGDDLRASARHGIGRYEAIGGAFSRPIAHSIRRGIGFVLGCFSDAERGREPHDKHRRKRAGKRFSTRRAQRRARFRLRGISFHGSVLLLCLLLKIHPALCANTKKTPRFVYTNLGVYLGKQFDSFHKNILGR